MGKDDAGRSGQGHTGTTKYPAEDAPVVKNGGNEEYQDGISTEQSPESMYGGAEGSLNKAKGK